MPKTVATSARASNEGSSSGNITKPSEGNRVTKIFKIVGVIVAALGLLFSWHQYSISVSKQLHGGDEALTEAQKVIRANSVDGTEYDLSKGIDEEFANSVRLLMAYYETTTWQARFWIVNKIMYDERVSCAVIKHAQVFLDGQGAPGMWQVKGKPFLSGYKGTRAYVASMKGNLGDCEQHWRDAWKRMHPNGP